MPHRVVLLEGLPKERLEKTQELLFSTGRSAEGASPASSQSPSQERTLREEEKLVLSLAFKLSKRTIFRSRHIVCTERSLCDRQKIVFTKVYKPK
jgi:hypothetical protein